MDVLARINRFNQRHPWSHNDRLARWVTRQVVASGAGEALDVGCGTGNLVDRLRRHVRVTGLEPDPASAAVATRRFALDGEVTICEVGFADRDRDRRWEAVTMVAVLHHLTLAPTLRELRGTVAVGGRLVVVGCYRESERLDLLVSLLSAVLNPVVGAIKHPAPASSLPAHMRAPIAPPGETLEQIKSVARTELPGSRIRRRLFWRYTLVYDAVTRPGQASR